MTAEDLVSVREQAVKCRGLAAQGVTMLFAMKDLRDAAGKRHHD